jgi:hypothetical protein
VEEADDPEVADAADDAEVADGAVRPAPAPAPTGDVAAAPRSADAGFLEGALGWRSTWAVAEASRAPRSVAEAEQTARIVPGSTRRAEVEPGTIGISKAGPVAAGSLTPPR